MLWLWKYAKTEFTVECCAFNYSEIDIYFRFESVWLYLPVILSQLYISLSVFSHISFIFRLFIFAVPQHLGDVYNLRKITINTQESLESLIRAQIRVLESQLYNKSSELQEDISMKKFDLQTKRLHLAAMRAQVSALEWKWKKKITEK